MKKSFIHVYTGDGKGKTTAAMGLMLRALGAGKRVCFIQFMKGRGYSEHNIIPSLSENLRFKTVGKPYFIGFKGSIPEEVLKELGSDCVVFEKGHPPQDYIDLVRDGLDEAWKALESAEYDLVILDELCCAVYFGLVDEDEVIDRLGRRNESTEVVITGRNASDRLIDYADLVTYMKEVKHYYSEGVSARQGIDN